LEIPLIKKTVALGRLVFRYIRTDISSQIKPPLAIHESAGIAFFPGFRHINAQKKMRLMAEAMNRSFRS
jgi:hypothetical protein